MGDAPTNTLHCLAPDDMLHAGCYLASSHGTKGQVRYGVSGAQAHPCWPAQDKMSMRPACKA
jgi:hypothetical protein